MRTRVVPFMVAMVAIAGIALPVRQVAGETPVLICPPLGPVADAKAFFVERGFPAGATDHAGATATWRSSIGPITATVEGDDIASKVGLEAFFTAHQSNPDDPTKWGWSAEQLASAFQWGEEIMVHFGDSAAWVEFMKTTPPTYPGYWELDSGDRKARMEVGIDGTGLKLSSQVVTTGGDPDACPSVLATPGPAP